VDRRTVSIRPPSAAISAEDVPSARESAARTRDVLIALTQSDLRARYGRGPLRLLKWLLDPFALVGVYLLLVVVVLDREGSAPGLSLACAVIPFQLLMMSVIASMSAIKLRKPIILNMGFRRSLIPLSSVMTETVAFGASLFLLVLMMAAYRVEPTFALLWLPLVLFVNIAFAVACAYPGALFGLWFPDLRVFAISFVRTLFFLAPGLVALAEIPDGAAGIVRLNPLTGLFESYRSIFLYGEAPAAWHLLYPLAIAAALLAIFVPIYRTEQYQFAKVVE
jgi:ABC-type polysaccharide/polyol phosphate export permease